MSGFNQPPADEPAEVPAEPVEQSRVDSVAGRHHAATAVKDSEITDEELSRMSTAELAELGGRLDHVTVLSADYPLEPGSRAEKRAERRVAMFFGLAALFGLLFVVAYIWWPWEVNALGPTETGWAMWYTPVLGVTLGATLLFMGAGLVIWAKKLMPHEVSVQTREDTGPSSELERRATAATLVEGADALGVNRRTLIRRSLLGAGGVLGLATIIPLGGLIKNPYKDKALWFTDWKAGMRLVRANGTPVRPGDMQPGSMETVYPPVEGAHHHGDASTMLIRMHHDQAQAFEPRPMNEGSRWNEYVAYSKICTHLGCPVSLYEQETGRILCPCHQSQFQITEDAKPVFGPATRSLPSLPIEVDDEGYFVAKSDYKESVGPAFWDRQWRPENDGE